MARLLAGYHLAIERSDIDLLLAHLRGWVPRGKNVEFNDLDFLNALRNQQTVTQVTLERFARAYSLESAFSRRYDIWAQIYGDILGSAECIQRLQDARACTINEKRDLTVGLINWIAAQTAQLSQEQFPPKGKKQDCASSKLAMFLWPELPVFINDSFIRETARYIGTNEPRTRIRQGDYGILWDRCAFLYHPMRDRPFITLAQMPQMPSVACAAYLNDEWLSRRLLDLALYRAVIVDGPAPHPNAPHIKFCQCALLEIARDAA